MIAGVSVDYVSHDSRKYVFSEWSCSLQPKPEGDALADYYTITVCLLLLVCFFSLCFFSFRNITFKILRKTRHVLNNEKETFRKKNFNLAVFLQKVSLFPARPYVIRWPVLQDNFQCELELSKTFEFLVR